MKSYLIKYLGSLLFLLLSFSIAAQPVNTLYFLRGVPQSNQLNPAFQPAANCYIGVPGVSTIQFTLSNNSLIANDVLYYDAQLDSVITFLHEKGDKNKFLNSLKSTNQLQSDFQINILDFGFKVNSYYLSFGVALKNSMSIAYPKDFARFGLNLFEDGAKYDFSAMHLSEMAYTEYSMGLAKNINDKWQFGVRGKLLMGIGTFQTSKMDMKLNSSIDKVEISCDNEANISVPNLDLRFNAENGYVDTDSSDMREFSSSDYRKLAFNPKNSGVAVDLGVVYKPIEAISLSASVVDFGRIWWRDNVYNLKQQGHYNFEGVVINDINNDSAKYFDQYVDTLKNSIKATNGSSNFSTPLATKLYFGTEFNPVKWFSLGLLSRTIFYPTNVWQEFTVSAQLHPIRMISTSVSYSFNNNNFTSIGAGLALNFGLMRFYIVSDHIPLYYGKQLVPYKAGMIDVRFGWNWMFGNPEKKARIKERPMMS